MNDTTSIVGVRVDPQTGKPLECAEREHFYVCESCGQAVDMRDIGKVLHHEQPEHAPLRLDS